MKKLPIALAVLMGFSVGTSHAWTVPGPFIPAAAGTGSFSVVPGVVFGAAMIYAANTKPHYSLSDSCKLQNVKREGANYSFASYKHCTE